jgi:hypothetical protein
MQDDKQAQDDMLNKRTYRHSNASTRRLEPKKIRATVLGLLTLLHGVRLYAS